MARNSFSPSLDIRIAVIDGLDVVAFGRRAYRVPTFNELYYVGYGNPLLKPEDAWMSDLGVEYLQGYYYSKPIPEDRYLEFLKEKNLITLKP